MTLYDIPAHHPFLPSLATGILATYRDQPPEALSRATILLPTRRSARGLRDAFLAAAGDRALLLPRMRALAGLSTEDADELALPTLLTLPPAVPALTRQAVLTSLVLRLPPRHGGPSTPEQAWGLAAELARLFDEIALEEPDPDLLANATPAEFAESWLARLDSLVPDSQATHWQITTTFLRAVATTWTAWLDSEGLLDIGLRRVLALREQTKAWREDPPPHPIIAAGIGVGGTIPAAIALLRLLATLPHGAVVLHGLDREALAPLWDAIADAPTHPFSSQARLLTALGATPRQIRPWPASAPSTIPEARPALLEMALRPPEGMAPWTERRPETWSPGLAGLSYLAAPDAQSEAAAIALTLREALESPGTRAALVTPDRDLASRVSAELIRHGIRADDSAGQPLAQTPTGIFLRLLSRAVAEDLSPVPLLALLKHPLSAAGLDRAAFLDSVRLLERRILRGPRPQGGFTGLTATIAALPDGGGKTRLETLLAALSQTLGLFQPARGIALPPADLLGHHLAAAEALATTPDLPGGLRLYAAQEGEVLATHLADLAPALAHLPPLDPAHWPALFEASLEGIATRQVRLHDSAHPRVEILGLLEARLLSFDRLVLGALDETVWPLATDPGPWMSRPMRAQFGLPEPESRIGRVATDFLLFACAAEQAVFSRAARRGGAPTVPARWLTRLETFLGGQGLTLPRSDAPNLAAALDLPARITPISRPAPRPTLAQRPREITVTEIADLLADPYAFHAKRILRLRRLDPLDADIGALDYGIIVHGALSRLLPALTPWPGEAAARLAWQVAAEAALAAQGPRPALAAFWRPRLARIGDFVLAQEAEPRAHHQIARSWTETEGALILTRPLGKITLKARADRIDRLGDGTLHILDYKTGTLPKPADLSDGSAPQLPLEAALAAAGAFAGIPATPVRALTYWKLSGGETPGEVKPMVTEPEDVALLAASSLDSLARLIDRYLLGPAAFPARPHPARKPRSQDYDHLSRIAEWQDSEDDQ